MKNYTVLTALLSVAVFAEADSDLKRWSKVTEPAPARPIAQSIGDYTAGCIRGAVSLPFRGEGYQVMRLSRKRYYGHPTLIAFIESMGLQAVEQGWGTLLIGDLGQPRGGPTLTGHRSHQTGLDVDIWYLLSQQASLRSLTMTERERWGAPSMLQHRSDRLDDAQWTPRHEQMLETAARMPEVERIFVNPSIKRELCERSVERDWLSKIRPWWGHHDHFHVRLKCPVDSPDCRSQEPVPDGDGCDASLEWWFTAEARAPQPPKGPVAPLALPAQCEKILFE
ncbi:MAG: hypothetical protein Kow0065_24220 [Methylomicrobium sp.]